jgi:predicted AlkP superfamily pyrophosphatase or phosphodiesterase
MRLAALLLTVLVLFAGCRSKSQPVAVDKNGPPILLIGLDGFEWDVVLPMLHAGRLPVLQQLMEKGAYGILTTRTPTSSPMLWTTIATGKVPLKHGIKGFVHKQIKGTRPLYTNADRKTKAFWNIYSDYGLSVHLIGWWLTYPVEPINGVMVAQTNTIGNRKSWRGALIPDMEDQVYPADRINELSSLVQDVEKRLPSLMDQIFGAMPPDIDEELDQLLSLSRWAVRADAIYQEIAENLAREQSVPQISTVYFGASDTLAHRFWQFYQPKSSQSKSDRADARQLGEILPRYYAHLDSMIGKLIRLYPKETTVFVLSDHGNGPMGHHTQPPPHGFFVAAGTHIKKAAVKPIAQLNRSDLQNVGSILDITPTLLALKRIPLGKDMDGRVLRNILDPATTSAQPQPVSTHDTQQWVASRPKVKPGKDVDPERLEQLRALGYIQ